MSPRVLIACLFLALPAFAADDFYTQQLSAGKADAQAQRLVQAADELRIAAFGLLDAPPLLQEALARLAVVQNALGRSPDAAKTIERFISVEQRFPTYGTLPLEPAVKSAFDQLLVANVPRATLQGIASMAPLANYEFQRIAQLPAAQRIAAYEAGAQRDPKNVQWPLALAKEAAALDANADVIRWATKALEIDPANKDARALLAHARAAQHACKDALAIIASLDLQNNRELYADQTVCLAEVGRWSEAESALANVPANLQARADVKRAAQQIATAKARAARANATPAPQSTAATASSQASGTQTAAPPATSPAASATAATLDRVRTLIKDGKYAEAVQVLRPAMQRDPSSRLLKLAMLEAAVLAREWRTASAQVPTVTPLATGEELYMFYASVALYETGRHDEAKTFMQKASPRMVPSPMVDFYRRAILGEGRGS